jgi:DNA modification methylase
VQVQDWPVERPVPYPGNPRKIPAKAVDKVAASIAEFGFQQPMVVDEKDVILVGHTRLLAAQKLGLAKVPVKVAAGLTPAQAKAYRLADNRTNQEAQWDLDLLGLEFEGLDGFDLSLTGFDMNEIDSLVGPGEGATAEDDAPEAPDAPVSQPGDVWLCGPHRVLCGDATKMDDVERALAGDVPAMIITSPPYNQKINKFHPSGMHKEADWVSKVQRLAYSDDMPESDYQNWQQQCLLVWFDVLKEGGSFFYNHKNRYRTKRVVSPLEWLPGPFNLRQEIIWRRPGSVTQNARMFMPCDERVYWLYKGSDFTFNNETEIKTWSSVWDISPTTNKNHAVAFPAEIPRRCMMACSSLGGLVFDPFLGSGTTMIAAETTGRVCYGIEISPAYVDVIVKRWQSFTGERATHEESGEKFPGDKAGAPEAEAGDQAQLQAD